MWKIIRVNESDGNINKVTEILIEIHNELFSDKAEQKYFSDILNNDKYLIYCLIESDFEEILGYIVYYDTFENIDLFEIGIRKIYQGKGYGNILLKETSEIIYSDMEIYENDRGKETVLEKKIFLEVDENNDKAIKLYEKNGFKKISIRKNYYGNGKNAAIMAKIRKIN
ncbi:GNAT family N-acetyltransferase [Leptotrichia sp. OH3620_COT-345]|uniref:GNAT family N-acetyltransferase n=1 Tax=Leptotrichia sp. OH3620_COT-345 TaxID=2491048 RepID=UPI000F646DA2|nr:GNAT family N-acetyltransferase [Leptotrichia sp. OH3620_COT-345]RRD40487.1 GNAT family N-acetyltransferase [Leptotrichia sp. OH3620_COT-345]